MIGMSFHVLESTRITAYEELLLLARHAKHEHFARKCEKCIVRRKRKAGRKGKEEKGRKKKGRKKAGSLWVRIAVLERESKNRRVFFPASSSAPRRVRIFLTFSR